MVILGTIERSGKTFKIETEQRGQSLLTLLQENHIYIDAECNGRGTCGKCVVCMKEGVTLPTEKEKIILPWEELKKGMRLACEILIERDCTITIPAGNQNMKVVSNRDEFPKTGQKSFYGEREYGIAVDIGTTTLAAELVDLESGEIIDATTDVNHQRAFGADVIARMQASNEGKGPLLEQYIKDDLNKMIDVLIEKNNPDQAKIKSIVIAGNTTMLHLLQGFSCETLGVAPFIPVDLSMRKISCEELLARQDLQAEVVILPGISAFIGGDIVAGIYSSAMWEREEPVLLLDVGTNGEMVMGNRHGLLATSAAAGPVFEGANISCGVPAVPGAISHVHIKGRENYECKVETIDQVPPIGICGTGIIDAISELVRVGLIDENGTLEEEWFEEGFPIWENRFFLQERDIREIQMGKSAIRAGIETLIEEYGREPEQIYLAGGFGVYMDVASAVGIGLLPQNAERNTISIGNSSLEGAKRFLLEGERAEACLQWIVEHTREINLAMHAGFQERYMQYMFFESQKP